MYTCTSARHAHVYTVYECPCVHWCGYSTNYPCVHWCSSCTNSSCFLTICVLMCPYPQTIHKLNSYLHVITSWSFCQNLGVGECIKSSWLSYGCWVWRGRGPQTAPKRIEVGEVEDKDGVSRTDLVRRPNNRQGTLWGVNGGWICWSDEVEKLVVKSLISIFCG